MKKKFNDFGACPFYAVAKFNDMPKALLNDKQSLKTYKRQTLQLIYN
jgi:hypothetical protein